MLEQDSIQRFLIENEPVRLEIVRLRKTYEDVSERHTYPSPVKKLLGSALAATALLSATIKFSGKLTLQTQNTAPITLLVAQGNHDYQLRGLAKWKGEITEDSIKKTFADGHLGITIAPASGEEYRGIVKLSGVSLAESLENYFQHSEQLPTKIYLAANEKEVIGILLQIIPGNFTEEQSKLWHQVSDALPKLDESKLFTISNQEILQKLAPNKNIQIVDSKGVTFYCDCTVERMERAIKVLGYKEAKDILMTNQFVTVTCEFCNKQHDFTATDVEKIFLDSNFDTDASVH